MAQNNFYSWNQTLKFSWGHIIAFVALIFISYVAYMGDFYQNGGDFKSAALKVCCIDIALLVTFMGAQVFKGVDEKFDRSLIIERILICLSAVAFIWAMIPYNHFWNVFSEREQIESQFNISIERSRQMFEDYEQYADQRIRNYGATLSEIIGNKDIDYSTYVKAGFSGFDDGIVKDNYIETLKLQLLSENTDSLRQAAMEWIDRANQGASVWNAFLVGNVENISDAIKGWNEELNTVSTPILSNENALGGDVAAFDENQESYEFANSGLVALRQIYTEETGVNITTLWTGVILLFMLLLPYLLQRRNEKARGYYSLLNFKKGSKSKAESVNDVRSKTTRKDSSTWSPVSSETPSRDRSRNINRNTQSANDDIFSGTF